MDPIASNTEILNAVVEQKAQVERAKFGDRFFATIVDNIIVKIPLTVVFMFLLPLWANPYFGLFFAVCVELVVTLLYFGVFAHRRGGQTWGKSWNKVKVTDLEGTNLTLGHFIIREFVARGVPVVASVFFRQWANLWVLTYLLALSKNKRALHDLITGTQVIKVK